MLGVRLDAELEKKLERYSKKVGKPKSACVKQALKEFLDHELEAERHDRQTLKGWQQIEEGEEIPIENVFSYLKTWEDDQTI